MITTSAGQAPVAKRPWTLPIVSDVLRRGANLRRCIKKTKNHGCNKLALASGS